MSVGAENRKQEINKTTQETNVTGLAVVLGELLHMIQYEDDKLRYRRRDNQGAKGSRCRGGYRESRKHQRYDP